MGVGIVITFKYLVVPGMYATVVLGGVLWSLRRGWRASWPWSMLWLGLAVAPPALLLPGYLSFRHHCRQLVTAPPPTPVAVDWIALLSPGGSAWYARLRELGVPAELYTVARDRLRGTVFCDGRGRCAAAPGTRFAVAFAEPEPVAGWLTTAVSVSAVRALDLHAPSRANQGVSRVRAVDGGAREVLLEAREVVYNGLPALYDSLLFSAYEYPGRWGCGYVPGAPGPWLPGRTDDPRYRDYQAADRRFIARVFQFPR